MNEPSQKEIYSFVEKMNIFDDNKSILEEKNNMKGQSAGGLIQQGVNGCIFHPTLTCKKPKFSNNNEKFVTKIQEANWISNNEEDIGIKISSLANYRKYFAPVIKSCPVKNINRKELRKHFDDKDKYGELCNLFNYELNMLNLQYIPYIENIDFKDLFLYRIKDKDLRLSKYNINVQKRFFKTYLHLLNAADLLNKKNIIHNDLHQYNIVYDLKQRLPIILDFGYSLDAKSFDPKYSMLSFIKSNQKMVNNLFRFKNLITVDFHYPWDEVVLHEFVKNSFKNRKKNNLGVEKIPELLEDIKNDIRDNIHSSIKGFSPDFRKQYLNTLLNYIDGFKNKSPDQAYQILVKHVSSWNLFVISMIFCRMINAVFNTDIPFDEHNNYFGDFIKVLLLNIHPNPEKRLSIKESKQRVFRIYKKNFK